MEFKGTPGPWFCMNETDVFTGLNSTNASGIKSDKTDGWQITDCSVGKTFVDGEYVELGTSEQIANARLIAAAPEMLDALIKIVEMNQQYAIDKYGDVRKAEEMACVRTARSAINKALGGK